MRDSLVATVAVAGVLAPLPAALRAQDMRAPVSAASLVGAWRIVSRTYISPDSSYTEHQRDPGYYLFVSGTYAFVAPSGTALRPTDQHSEARRIALYNTFGAQAGPYALQGDTLTLHTAAAKNQGNVGMTIRWRASFHGDTLMLESRGTYKRATRDRARYVLVRAGGETSPDQSGPHGRATIHADGAAGEGAESTSVARQIEQLDWSRFQAVRRADTAALDTLLADDWLASGSAVLTKREYLDALGSGRRSYGDIRHDDVRVRVYGDAAIVTGRSTGPFQVDGRELNASGRFTHIYVKRDGRWIMVGMHNSPIVRTLPADTAGSSRPSDSVVAEIGRLRKVLPAAWIRGDIAMLDTLIADDYISISGRGSVTKRQSLAPIASGARRILSLTYDSVKVRAFGDVAVETGWVQGDAVSDGVVQVGKGGRYTLVFVRRNGRWQLVSHQYTPNQGVVPPAASGGSGMPASWFLEPVLAPSDG